MINNQKICSASTNKNRNSVISSKLANRFVYENPKVFQTLAPKNSNPKFISKTSCTPEVVSRGERASSYDHKEKRDRINFVVQGWASVSFCLVISSWTFLKSSKELGNHALDTPRAAKNRTNSHFRLDGNFERFCVNFACMVLR